MKKLKASIEGKKQWEGLLQTIALVESNRDSNPNVVLDGAKSILESIAKTILTTKGIAYDPDSSVGYLVKLAFKNLPVFSEMEARDTECSAKILSALSTVCTALGEFRNLYGFFSHGTDLHAEKFDRYLIELAIGASDLLGSFLITSHAEDHRDRNRLFYEDYPEFNNWLDEQGAVEVQGIPLSASLALFKCDLEAYKEQLNWFESEKEGLIRKLEVGNSDSPVAMAKSKEEKAELIRNLEESGSFRDTHSCIAALSEFISFFTSEEIRRLIQAKNENTQISMIQTDEDIAQFYSTIELLQSTVDNAI